MQADHIEFFRTQGYLRLNGFHPKARMQAPKRHIEKELARLNIWLSGKVVSRQLKELPVFQQIGRVSNSVKVSGLQGTLMTGQLLAAMNALAGGALSCPQDAQLLLSLPQQGEWTLSGLDWHVDIGADGLDRLPGIQAFFLIDDVAPRGGATLAVAGSHRIDSATHHKLRHALKATPGGEDVLRDMGLEVIEMSGRAGDIVLMDLRLLHTPSINATRRIRMMATVRCFRAEGR
ncbi:phytanoyl-CoA dioxygenase family protein [Variovorax sp. DT-64]|uniref:phytanoyl-CoA dioxygenase family protein n=1 Tax=Variovorax sp. DT-64 TaxID=3396160 RepID=UPI003F1A7CC0